MVVTLSMPATESFIACLAIIGKHPFNNPLYIRVFSSRSSLDFHYFLHAALDIVDEKTKAPRRKSAATTTADQNYLGELCAVEDYKIYGYITNGHIKLMTVLEEGETREADIRSLLCWLHKLYVDTMMNPFCSLEKTIKSTRFDEEVGKVVSSFDKIFNQHSTSPTE